MRFVETVVESYCRTSRIYVRILVVVAEETKSFQLKKLLLANVSVGLVSSAWAGVSRNFVESVTGRQLGSSRGAVHVGAY